jgi:hypothetical protein
VIERGDVPGHDLDEVRQELRLLVEDGQQRAGGEVATRRTHNAAQGHGSRIGNATTRLSIPRMTWYATREITVSDVRVSAGPGVRREEVRT